jgi:hypothetical protein
MRLPFRLCHRLPLRLSALATLAALSGCAHTTPGWDSRFGETVRVATAAQVLHPEAVRNTDTVAGIDGRAARAAYERYQKSFAEPAPAPAMLLISSGAK